MKRRVLIDLSVVIVLCAALTGCEKNIQAARELATAVAQKATAAAQATADARLLAQQVADALGRTPANSIFEYRSCGMGSAFCGHNVFFTSPDDPGVVAARITALSKRKLAARGGYYSGNHLFTNDGRYNPSMVESYTLTFSTTVAFREPAGLDWVLVNEKCEFAVDVWLWLTKDTGVTYLLHGKPLPNANIVELWVSEYPAKSGRC